jgi:hypothetical protein
MHKPRWLVIAVVTLLAYGCPLQAIVAAFGLDERTVARWQRESGVQCRRVHQHLIEAGRVALLQVSRPMRSGSQGGRCALLAGLCDGGQKPIVARRDDQPPPRQRVDPGVIA